MSESDKRRDDEQGDTPEWNIPEIEAAPGGDGDELPVAVRRVLATDRHLRQRRAFFGQAGEAAPEPKPPDEGELPR